MADDEEPVLFECGFQETDCDYRGKNGVCLIEEEEGNAVCPAGE